MHGISITLTFTVMASVAFGYTYWRDSTKEGFSSDKILDSFFLILLGGFLGGKLLFRPLSMDYFRYQFFTSPMILEGVLVGGGLSVYVTDKRNNWSHWKIGDMLAPAITLFQAILFLGFWFENHLLSSIYISSSFFAIYAFMRFLKNKKYFGSSARFFWLKRLNKPVFTGGLFAVYLTGSSAIAMLFLITHQNLKSWFWWFQIVFYLCVFTVAYVLFASKHKKIGLSTNTGDESMSQETSNVVSKLVKRAREIARIKSELKKNDPFMVEAEEGFRNQDEMGDEVSEQFEHANIQAVEDELTREEKSIKAALKRIKEGKYGVCVSCGAKISKKRLFLLPTTRYCADCKRKIEK